MKKLTIEQIKALDINTKVMVTSKITGESIGQYRIINKGFCACGLIKEDDFEIISNGKIPFPMDVLTYWFVRRNFIELYELSEKEENEKDKFFEELTTVLKDNIESVHPELRGIVEYVAMGITESFFEQIEKSDMQGEEIDLCCNSSGAVDGLKIEYALDTKEYRIYFETEEEMSYNEAMEYLTDIDAKFRVESAIMDDLIETAIEYEDELSMSDEEYDSLDDFLDAFLKEDYSSMHDIMKFIYFYGQPEDIQELIENGRWFMEK